MKGNISEHDLAVRQVMQVEVHAGDGGSGEVFLMPAELAPEHADATALFGSHLLSAKNNHLQERGPSDAALKELLSMDLISFALEP